MSYQPYEPYDAAAAPAPTTAPAGGDRSLGAEGPWRVAIEYSNQGQSKPPTLIRIGQSEHTDREQALLAAHRAALEFEPPDPWSLQRRDVYRDGPDGFLVVLHGATTTFHMSVRIVAPLAPPLAPQQP